MKRVRYKIYLTTGAILVTESSAKDLSTGMFDVCRTITEGMWTIRLVNGAQVCVNPAHVTHVTAEEIEE